MTTSRYRARETIRDWNKSMLALAGLMVITGVVSVGGLLFDDRMLGGQPIWGKPFKFSVSIALYALTWAWLAARTTKAPRTVRAASAAAAGFMGLEMVIIVAQVARGTASHFNRQTEFDLALWQMMGASIIVVWLGTFVLTALLARSEIADRTERSAARLGAAISLVGMAVAFFMTTPTPEQLRQYEADQEPAAIGAHAVGVADGGPGLPILGWSTTGGDLRIGHFVGMHALQLLPLLAMALGMLAARWPTLRAQATRTRLVRITAASHFGLTALVTWQALRGQSIVAPDVWTLLAFGALVGGTALAVAWALRSGTSTTPPAPHGTPVRTDSETEVTA